MIVIFRPDATREQVDTLSAHLRAKGIEVHESPGVNRVVLGLVGDLLDLDPSELMAAEGVQRVVRISEPYRLASRLFRDEASVYEVNGIQIGGGPWALCAGPCAVEDRAQIETSADFAARAGAAFLRGGAWKPRTSPYAFQGGGREALKLLADTARREGLLVVTEVLDVRDVDTVQEYADVLQVGSRNMTNTPLLKELAGTAKPVLLKRGLASTVEEWLQGAEYLMQGGNFRVILCERGIRSFDPATRNVLDLAVVPLVKRLSHLPVWVDPSHAAGNRDLVPDLALAALAAGADGIMVEFHPRPAAAKSDGAQSLFPDQFVQLTERLRALGNFLGRPIARRAAPSAP